MAKIKKPIKSSKCTIKFANKVKLDNINIFIDEYKVVMDKFIDLLWDMPKITKLMPKEITSQIQTWLSARMIQCAGKQASGIIRGARKKQEKRKWKIDEFIKRGYFKQARKLSRIYEEASVSKPKLDNIEPELDSRFVKINFNNTTSFDGWITLGSIGNKLKIIIPVKKHKHFNKLNEKGKIKPGIRISKYNMTFMFDLPEPKLITEGKVKAIDIGKITLISCSDGQVIDKCPHGHNLDSICKVMSRKKKGTMGFRSAETHRDNYLNWSVKQLNLGNIKQINREDIKYLNKGKTTSREMSHWTYAKLFEKLDNKINESGVQLVKVNPTYTSQRCSCCGWVCKSNREKKWFKCVKCNFVADADLNASINISLPLEPIYFGGKQQLKLDNKIGFYWKVLKQEFIVPVAQKSNSS